MLTISPAALVGILILCAVCVGVMVSNTVRARRLEIEARTFRAVAQGASDGLLLQAEDSKVLWVNDAYVRLMGRPRDELIGQYPLEFALPEDTRLSPEDARAFRFDPEADPSNKLETTRNVRGDGTEFINQLSVGAVILPGGDGRSGMRFVTSCRDVTEQVQREEDLFRAHEQIKQQTRTDSLTGIANRARLTAVMERAVDSEARFALFALDLNDFKALNDTYGHAGGDAALVHVARKLSESADSNWTVGRLGGDEFLVFAPFAGSMFGAAKIALRLRRAIEQPIDYDGKILKTRVSIGVALTGQRLITVDRLMRDADTALYVAKQRPRHFVACYDDAMAQKDRNEKEMRRALIGAIEAETIDFHFQPTLNLQTGIIRGFELLVRWSHPELGRVAPAVLIPLVEDIGMMERLDRLAVKAAVQAWKDLSSRGWTDVVLGVNVTPVSLVSAEFVDFLIWEVDAHDMPADQMVIEVLETTFFALDGMTDVAETQIARLREAGFNPFLDDFGAGYAGLAHLAGLSITGVKIDKALVARIATDEASRMIVRSIAEVCRHLGLQVLGEGIEDADQMATLKSVGCTHAQGWHIGRPRPLSDVLDLYPAGHWPESEFQLPTGPNAPRERPALPSASDRSRG